GAYGRSATGVAGDEGKRQSGQRRLMPGPFGRREDAFGEARDVVRGVRVALGFLAGEQIDSHGREARGLQGQLDRTGRLLERRMALRVKAQRKRADVRRVVQRAVEPDAVGGNAELGVTQFHESGPRPGEWRWMLTGIRRAPKASFTAAPTAPKRPARRSPQCGQAPSGVSR